MLIVLSGLPGSGKTTIARLLARRLGAVHLRIDTIEQALRAAGAPAPAGPEGYLVAYGVAADNLRLGGSVVADAVNASHATRSAWEAVARGCDAPLLHVQVACTDLPEHRRRVRDRRSDIAGQVLPSWEEIARIMVDPPSPGAVRVDTAACTPQEAVDTIVRALGAPA